MDPYNENSKKVKKSKTDSKSPKMDQNKYQESSKKEVKEFAYEDYRKHNYWILIQKFNC